MPVAFRVFLLLAILLIRPLSAQAQQSDQVWLQIEAQPTLAVAQERAEAYAGVFPETSGFRLKSGWYAIVLGPYGVAEGAARLNALKAENLIPRDSFIADGARFADPFWPTGAAPAAEPAPVVEPEPALQPMDEPEETQAEARASEAALTNDERKELQTALQWFGFYNSTIDGSFGKGTRASMAAWQEAMGLEATGILTSRQRATLVANHQAEVAEFGFTEVSEQQAGIQVTLPMALVEFDHYEPPFVHYRAKDGGPTLVLISQPGDAAALTGLYDVLQTLKAVPASGPRDITGKEFRIHGTSATQDSHAWAALANGTVKGFMLISTPENAERDARILEVMEASFKSTGATALDPGMVPMEEGARRGLLAGLEVRKPKFSRTGFYVDAKGAVLTTAEAVAQCGRITLDHDTEATVVTANEAGLALLTPATPLAPSVFADFQTAPDRIGAEVSVAGYSYEDRLPAPVLTFGTLEDSKGLEGEAGVKRLALMPLVGDTGGPVLDGAGGVQGMLLPAATGGAQQLPSGVAFAASAEALTTFLKAQGITVTESSQTTLLPPVKLTEKATGMTVLVSCWE